MTRRASWGAFTLVVVALVLATACGSGSSNAGSGDAGPSSLADGALASSDDGGGMRITSGAEAGSPGSSLDAGDASDFLDGGAPAYSPVVVTTPIPTPTPETWTWVPLAGALCRDGSATGIGINVNPASPYLMIYLEGGGSCFDPLSCGSNPSAYAESDFHDGPNQTNTIFDRTLTTNPVKDWSFVYVPYCTGDQHGGNALGVTPRGTTGTQDFVGYVDLQLALARVVPSFPDVTRVLLTGGSAGGAGVVLTYALTQRMFGSVPVDALDDSGPPMSSMYLADCLGQIWGDTWRYDRTVLADCGSACAGTADQAIHVLQHIAQANPHNQFGVLDSIDDGVISALYGYGTNSCAAYPATTDAPPTPLDAATFAAGQLDARTQMAAYPNFGSFLFPGKQHTTLKNSNQTYPTLTAGNGGVLLTSWVGSLVAGSVSNVGP